MAKKAPIPTQPFSIEREYTRFLLLYQKKYEQLISESIRDQLPILKAWAKPETIEAISDQQKRLDVDIPKSIANILEQIQKRLESAFPDALLQRWIKRMMDRVYILSAKNQAKHLEVFSKGKRTGKIEIGSLLLSNKKKLDPYFQNILDQNIQLIRSIPQSKIPALKNALTYAVTNDLSNRDIAKMIQKNFQATKNQARLIARDQVGKLNGSLDQYQQEQIGVKKYIWRTMHDKAVRPDHDKLDGTVQRWDKPPIVDKKSGRRGHPKDDFQCRCFAEAILDDVLDE